MSNFTIKQTKGRTHFNTGAVRSDDTGKPQLALLPWDLFPRLADHYLKGANIYGNDNWRYGMNSSHVEDSMMRHVQQYWNGDKDEDHLSAIIFNAFCLMYNEMTFGDEVHDLPKLRWDKNYKGKEND